ncbi:HGxxPAAW family protein [Marinactinospora thermotolerans]|uniref:Uncharacterized protein n=1 Tax=Marinactinospora thermotolerans DSM 45154 TaxID=1122192 RepID=A0A1T4S936_9ACTN|nr:HGxxPAAW family protein [Marinactinospora thermotolerans]SKA24418.1 hypothetical protein SAMN02745673_03306 [Marinactinospora thermotolerans DSM 45154]
MNTPDERSRVGKPDDRGKLGNEPEGGKLVKHSSHRGRWRSWIMVGVMTAGFVLAGVALTLGPTWWMFWAGTALFVVGGVVAYLLGIQNDVVLDEPSWRNPPREDRENRGYPKEVS